MVGCGKVERYMHFSSSCWAVTGNECFCSKKLQFQF